MIKLVEANVTQSVTKVYFKINSMVSHSIFNDLTLDNYFDDYDFEDRPILAESPRLNEFETNAYLPFR